MYFWCGPADHFLVPLLSKINGCKYKRLQKFSAKLLNLGFSTSGNLQKSMFKCYKQLFFEILFKADCRNMGNHYSSQKKNKVLQTFFFF